MRNTWRHWSTDVIHKQTNWTGKWIISFCTSATSFLFVTHFLLFMAQHSSHTNDVHFNCAYLIVCFFVLWIIPPGYCRFVAKSYCYNQKDSPVFISGLLFTMFSCWTSSQHCWLFDIYSCKGINIYNPTIQYDPEDYHLLETGASWGGFLHVVSEFFVAAVALACSFGIEIYIQIIALFKVLSE